MKIYLSHSRVFDYHIKIYAPLMASSFWETHEFILPHAASYDPINRKESIEACDLLIAEISYPSTGSGIEIGWAHAAGVRIMALHRNNAKPSSSIKIVTDEIFAYDDFVSSAERLLKKYLNQ